MPSPPPMMRARELWPSTHSEALPAAAHTAGTASNAMPQIVTTGEIEFSTHGLFRNSCQRRASGTSVVAPHSAAASEDYLNNSLQQAE